MNEYIDIIKKEGITAQIVDMLVEDHKADRERMYGQYERYKATIDGVPVLRRKPIEYHEDFETGAIKRIDNKVNNRLNNAFDSEIVDTKVGYMFGHAISYEVADDTKDQLNNEITTFNTRNTVEDEDSEWGKSSAICGYSSRLAYIDLDGKERIKNVDPWTAIHIGELTAPDYGLRYYEIAEVNAGTKSTKRKAEFYDGDNVHIFEAPDDGAFYFVESNPHMFDYCPLFGLPNNAEQMGDAEKVYSLIDAYDRTLSDASNEIEQYRLALLILRGMGADDEDIKQIRESGVMSLYDKDDDASYLTKDINDTFIENHLDRLEANILRFAKSVNFTDDTFGSISGVALRYKIMALENKCITMERKMSAALRYQYKLLCSSWAKRGICEQDDYLTVWFGFKRNLPVNVLEEGQATSNLKGMVSEKTRLSLLPFVDDVEYEMEEMSKETAERMMSLEEYEQNGAE